MTYETYNLDKETYAKALTQAKNLFINKLHEDGVLTDEQVTHYSEDFAIIVATPSLFRRVFKKNTPLMIVVEQHSITDEEDDE